MQYIYKILIVLGISFLAHFLLRILMLIDPHFKNNIFAKLFEYLSGFLYIVLSFSSILVSGPIAILDHIKFKRQEEQYKDALRALYIVTKMEYMDSDEQTKVAQKEFNRNLTHYYSYYDLQREIYERIRFI